MTMPNRYVLVDKAPSPEGAYGAYWTSKVSCLVKDIIRVGKLQGFQWCTLYSVFFLNVKYESYNNFSRAQVKSKLIVPV